MLTWKEKVWKLTSVLVRRDYAFDKVMLYLEENDEEQATVNDLIVQIKKYLWLVMMIMTRRG